MWRSKLLVLILVLAALLVRLIRIEQPFIDPWSWRQSDVAAIARNFFENGFHFNHPQIDWAGDAPGYVGTEFPILPFLAALCYRVTGVQDWIGRMESVLLFSAGLPFFFLLVRRICGGVAAIWATFFCAFAPLSVVTSRAFTPDAPSLSLAIIGVYFFLRWVEENHRRTLVMSAVFISLSFLIKITAAVIGPVLVYLLVAGRREILGVLRPLGANGGSEMAAPWLNGDSESVAPSRGRFARWDFLFFVAIALVPSAIWYWHAHRIAETSYPYHFFGGGGFRIMNPGWYWKIAREIVLSSLTPVLFILALGGAIMVPRGKYRWAFHWWLLSMGAFIFFVGWGNRHQWYQLPLVPVAAAFAGCVCQWGTLRLRLHPIVLTLGSVLIAALFGASSYHASIPFYQPVAAGLRNLGLELQEATMPKALIVAADNGNPTILYYAHRKGWHFTEDGLYQGPPVDSGQAIANLEKLRSRGASHLVFSSNTRWWLAYYPEFAQYLVRGATLVEETPEFTIYKLEPAAR